MKLIVTFSLSLITALCVGQHSTDLNALQPDKEYDNVHVHKLSSDTHASCFAIWVKKEVKAHKHEIHTENLYVMEGEGTMKIAEQEYSIKPGDFLNIPQNTVHSVVVTSKVPLKVISVQAPEFLGKDRVFVE